MIARMRPQLIVSDFAKYSRRERPRRVHHGRGRGRCLRLNTVRNQSFRLWFMFLPAALSYPWERPAVYEADKDKGGLKVAAPIGTRRSTRGETSPRGPGDMVFRDDTKDR